MTMPEQPLCVELVVTGALGPVRRAAVRPALAGPTQVCTIIGLPATTEHADVVELVRRLLRRGLDIDGVFTVPDCPTDGAGTGAAGTGSGLLPLAGPAS